MKFTKQEMERIQNAICFVEQKFMLKLLCVIVVHNETQEIIHVIKFTNFRKWLKKDPNYFNDTDIYTYKLKLLF